ncbi:MAG: PstS family phosphate ABC transporter substrate-binding protein [Armatimonadetes bacterium]|nr:PstS family phosphate ABC transporter substrate-binding protein [Armatimonadota bacterium]
MSAHKLSALLVVLVVCVSLVIAGCPKPQPTDQPSMDPAQLGGANMPEGSAPAEGSATTTIQAKGSDTLLQVAQALAEAYKAVKPGIEVSVTGGGSGTGFQALQEGTTDIANSSRSIKDEEVEACKAKGIEPVENLIGYDGIAVIVNKANPIEKLTIEQLSDIYTGAITDWKALGGKGEIVTLSRDTTSGTYEYFKEAVVQKGDKDSGLDFAASIVMLPSNSAIHDEVAKTENAIGYIGLGYLTDAVKAVPVVGKDGKPVSPAVDTVKDGSYPISRPLFMYTKKGSSPEVTAYLEWIMSDEGQKIVADEGFVPVK